MLTLSPLLTCAGAEISTVFGAAPTKYKWDTVPRQVIGEGVVLRTAPNASTVLLTFTLSEIYAGDYVELE